MGLAACARRPVESTPPAPVAIAVDVRTPPPAELLRCAERPAGFPVDQLATIPAGVRQAIIRVVAAFGRNADRQERLIAWERGKPCAEPLEKGAGK